MRSSSSSVFSLPLRLLVVLLMAGSLFALSPAQGQKTASREKSDAPTTSDPAALALRDKMIRAYRDLRSYHEKVTQKQWKDSPDKAVTLEIEMRYRAPNRLFLRVDYPEVAQEGRWYLVLACDGKNLTLFNSAKNEFQRVKAPARLDRIALPASLRGPEFPLLLRDTNPFAELEKQATVRYSEAFEKSLTGATDNLKLDLAQDGAKRVLLYRLAPTDHLLRGLRLSIQPDTTVPDPFLEPETASTLEADYTLVEINPRLPDSEFIFTPPAGAREKPKPAAPAPSP